MAEGEDRVVPNSTEIVPETPAPGIPAGGEVWDSFIGDPLIGSVLGTGNILGWGNVDTVISSGPIPPDPKSDPNIN